MTCPRCNEEVRYGRTECPHCGLRFKYPERKESRCRRSTACVLSFLFGGIGLHNFYLGFFLKGVIRMALFLAFCGFFLSPQLLHVFNEGRLVITFNAMGIVGLLALAAYLVSYMLAMAEFVYLVLGVRYQDSKGLRLQ